MVEIQWRRRQDSVFFNGSSVLMKDGGNKNPARKIKWSVKGIEKKRNCCFRMLSDGMF